MKKERYRFFALPSGRGFGNKKIIVDMETGQWDGLYNVLDIYKAIRGLYQSPLYIGNNYNTLCYNGKIKYLVDNLLNEEDKKRLGL